MAKSSRYAPGRAPQCCDVEFAGVDVHNVRYPDVTVYCEPRDFDVNLSEKLAGQYPSVLFEAFSPSTTAKDRGLKPSQYKATPSVRAIVLVDPSRRAIELYERAGELTWQETIFQPGATLPLAAIDVELSADDIFRSDKY